MTNLFMRAAAAVGKKLRGVDIKPKSGKRLPLPPRKCDGRRTHYGTRGPKFGYIYRYFLNRQRSAWIKVPIAQIVPPGSSQPLAPRLPNGMHGRWQRGKIVPRLSAQS